MPVDRVAESITLDQLRRYTLARQRLEPRAEETDVVAVVEQVGGLHATDHFTPYLSLLARIEGFRAEDLTTAWLRERVVDRRRLMRGTLYVVPTERLAELIGAFGELRTGPDQWGISDDERARLGGAILEAIERHGPQSAVSLKKLVPAELQRSLTDKYRNRSSNVAVVLRTLWEQGALAQTVANHSSTLDWRTAPSHYVRCDVPELTAGQAEADRAVAAWYFRAYGPATVDDWRWWSGLPAGRANAALAAIRPELAVVSVPGLSDALYLPADALDALRSTPDCPPVGVSVLPHEDNALKGYKATRSRFYDPDGRAETAAFNQYGEALPTILVDGRIAGTWAWDVRPAGVQSKKVLQAERSLRVQLFDQPDGATRKRLERELERVAAFLGADGVSWG